jgi:putative flippase GtrA
VPVPRSRERVPSWDADPSSLPLRRGCHESRALSVRLGPFRKRNRIIDARGLQPSQLDASVANAADAFDLRGVLRFEPRGSASWFQLLRFSVVGSLGYAVNLAIYTALLAVGTGFVAAASGSFVAAVVNNYSLNRLWTFQARRGRALAQGARYLTVSLVALLGNLGLLSLLIWAGMGELAAQGGAVLLVTPLSFLGNKIWSFGR